MNSDTPSPISLNDLPAPIPVVVTSFIAVLTETFEEDLRSVILFGSAAEARLRKSSDVNLLVVTSQFISGPNPRLADELALASASIDLNVMFLLEKELAAANELFAVKFFDISQRHRVLFGTNPLANLCVSKNDLIRRLRQVLLNQIIRTRNGILVNFESRAELVQLIAEMAGPLRAAAFGLTHARGQDRSCPKAALGALAAELAGDRYDAALEVMSRCREGSFVETSLLRSTAERLVELATVLLDSVPETLPS
jgi:predicted nucleotidyltransferase